MLEYLKWLLVFVILPLLFVWIFWFKELIKYKITHFFVIICSLIVSVPWDIISVKKDIWYFTEPYILGIWLFGLPIEEYLFIILISFLVSCMSILVHIKLGGKK